MAENLLPDDSAQFTPAIRWVPLGPLTVYHVTEQELDLLENGTPDAIYFSFAIFLLSTGSSFLATLLTADIHSQRLFNIFLIVTLFGLVGGLLLLVVFLRSRRSTSSMAKAIRSRKLTTTQPPS